MSRGLNFLLRFLPKSFNLKATSHKYFKRNHRGVRHYCGWKFSFGETQLWLMAFTAIFQWKRNDIKVLFWVFSSNDEWTGSDTALRFNWTPVSIKTIILFLSWTASNQGGMEPLEGSITETNVITVLISCCISQHRDVKLLFDTTLGENNKTWINHIWAEAIDKDLRLTWHCNYYVFSPSSLFSLNISKRELHSQLKRNYFHHLLKLKKFKRQPRFLVICWKIHPAERI